MREEPLEHDYKELTIPAVAGKHRDGSQCAAHLAARRVHADRPAQSRRHVYRDAVPARALAPNSFAPLSSPGDVEAFFTREFPSARALMPDLTREFFVHPQGSLGTVYTRGWHLNGDVLLLGDAAHAIVPFHGQGMNCAFEDCAELMRLMDEHHGWHGLFEAFERERRPNTDAIAQMALENYQEMREAVLDPEYRRKKKDSGGAGEGGSELHSALFDGDVPSRDPVFHCTEKPASRQREPGMTHFAASRVGPAAVVSSRLVLQRSARWATRHRF